MATEMKVKWNATAEEVAHTKICNTIVQRVSTKLYQVIAEAPELTRRRQKIIQCFGPKQIYDAVSEELAEIIHSYAEYADKERVFMQTEKMLAKQREEVAALKREAEKYASKYSDPKMKDAEILFQSIINSCPNETYAKQKAITAAGAIVSAALGMQNYFGRSVKDEEVK